MRAGLLLLLTYEKIYSMSRVKDTTSIKEIKDRLNPILEDKSLQLILLFGSAASDKMHKQSDIDLAFLFDAPVDILALTNKIIKFLHTNKIDIVDLRRVSPLLKFSIMKNGILIYEREAGIFNEFYSLAFRMYVDTKKLRDAQTTAIKYFLKKRGLT